VISAILLTAGQSKRMNGENKLTKEIKGSPLIKLSVKNILASSIDELIVVLGYQKEIIEKLIDKNEKIKFVFNKDFESGMASSIKTGLDNLSEKTEAFFICLGDMPMVNQNIYNKMIKTKLNYNKKLKPNFKKEIFIPTYEKKNGNPVLFTKHMKEKIMQISGNDGAKELIEIYKSKALHIPVKNRGITLDFDIQEDFNPSL
jgi:molybdenum cofactor cytidylyltransferase